MSKASLTKGVVNVKKLAVIIGSALLIALAWFYISGSVSSTPKDNYIYPLFYFIPTFAFLCICCEFFGMKLGMKLAVKASEGLYSQYPDEISIFFPLRFSLPCATLIMFHTLIPVVLTNFFAFSAININFLSSGMQDVARLLVDANTDVTPEQFSLILSVEIPKVIWLFYTAVIAVQFLVFALSPKVVKVEKFSAYGLGTAKREVEKS